MGELVGEWTGGPVGEENRAMIHWDQWKCAKVQRWKGED